MRLRWRQHWIKTIGDLVFLYFLLRSRRKKLAPALSRQKDYKIELENVLVDIENDAGQIKPNQLVNVAAAGAAAGALCGMLVVLFF